MTDYVQLAKDALTRPSDFGWFGGDDMFITWGMTGPSHAINSGDNLTESNLEAFKKMAHEKFGTSDDYLGPHFDVVGISHWAVGSLDQVITQVVRTDCAHDYLVEAIANDRGEYANKDHLEEDDLTDEFKFVCDTLIGLREHYPILDEEDFSEREYNDAYQSFLENLPHEIKAEKAGDIVQFFSDCGIYIDQGDFDDDDLYDAAYRLDADDREYDEEAWQVWELLNPGAVARRYAGRWSTSQLRLEIG